MDTHDVDAAPPAREPSTPAPGRSVAATSPAVWVLALLAAIAAGAGSWLVGEQFLDHYQPSEKAASEPYDHGPLNAEMEIVSGRNGAIAFGALGGLLGLFLGLAGGLSRRSAAAAVLGATVGLILGTAAGALPAFAIMPWHWRHRNDDPASIDLMVPLMTHLALWCALGLTAGLAYGLGRAGIRIGLLLRAILAGLIGAAVGTALYEILGAMAFPADRTTSPIADTAVTRLLARLCVTIATSVAVVLSLPPALLPSAAPAKTPLPE